MTPFWVERLWRIPPPPPRPGCPDIPAWLTAESPPPPTSDSSPCPVPAPARGPERTAGLCSALTSLGRICPQTRDGSKGISHPAEGASSAPTLRRGRAASPSRSFCVFSKGRECVRHCHCQRTRVSHSVPWAIPTWWRPPMSSSWLPTVTSQRKLRHRDGQ